MIDLVTPKSLKKSNKKKSKMIDLGLSDSIVKPDVKRRRRHESDIIKEPESTIPDEKFMLPSDIQFVKTDKILELDESTIPSDLDDPNNSQPLSNLIACRSRQSMPESGLKCVWSHKRKALKKNQSTCKCYSELEQRTLGRLKSIKLLKSKKRFLEHFADFEKLASDIQCEYPYCKRIDPVPATKHSVMCKLVKKSKRHKACRKTHTAQLHVGVKRRREEEVRKVRYSSYLINEVVRLMLSNTTVWCLDILTKLIKTKQLTSSVTRDVAARLVTTRDIPTLQLLVTNTSTCSEKYTVEIITSLLVDVVPRTSSLLPRHPDYPVTSSVDGPEEQHHQEEMLALVLSLPFEGAIMKRAVKPNISPHHATVLLSFIYEKLLNNAPVLSNPLNFNQVVKWCDTLVEVYFSTLVRETELARKIYHSINQHIYSCRSLFALNEFMFRIKHSKKFSQ